jgi:predicted GTPase
MDTQQAWPPVLADTRADFFAAMSELQAKFAAAAADIDSREATLQNALADIRYTLHDGVGETALAQSHALTRFMADFNSELAKILQDWLKLIEKHDRNTVFRKGFTDSLVVFVLGKVKSGKSSLGNYMAYGCSNPEGVHISGTQPYFFTAAMAQGEEDQAEAAVGQGGYFRVGARETTKSIQGFRVPGLTWVDSPGLHSVTPENGKLASDYADAADLIVYPMHTGNPGRKGDVAEIQGLLHAKKRFLVVITQCDKSEEDEAPDGSIVRDWVMKDGAARQGQIDHVRRAASTAGDAAPFDLLSLSVHFAETHDNSPEALEESGIADFFRLLTDIARSEGVRRKRDTPSRNLDHFVDLVLGADARSSRLSVVRVRERLRDLEKKLTAAAAELDHRARCVTAAVLSFL